MIVKIMEHIRQSSQQHASSSFNIAEYPTYLRPMVHQVSVFTFPVCDIIKKLVAIGLASDRSYFKKDDPQFSGVGCLRGSTAPSQPLPLNMNEASLDDDVRPEVAQYIHNLGIAINGKTSRAKTVTHEAFEEGHQLGNGAFRDRVLAGYNPVQIGVHQSNETSWAVQEGTVQDEMLASGQTRPALWWRLYQIIINHTVQLCWTMIALAGKLSNGVTFNNPAPEPLSLFGTFSRRITPAGRLLAGWTKPALLPIKITAISLQNS
jgi:hypothetical protein